MTATTTPEPTAPPAPDPVRAELVACLRDLHDYCRHESWFGMTEHEAALLDRARAVLALAETKGEAK